jgi:hypothetical protein
VRGTTLNWDAIKFHDTLAREISRLQHNEALSDIERETFIVALSELSDAVLSAEPYPMAVGAHLDVESLQALRDAIRLIQTKRIARESAAKRAFTYKSFDLMTQEEANCSGSDNVVVANFRSPQKT